MPKKTKRRRRKRGAIPTSASPRFAASASPRYIWGCAAIAKEIGRSANATDHMLRSGWIKSAKKIGHHWVADREALHAEMRNGGEP